MPPTLTAAVPTWRSCLQVPSAGLWAQCMYLDPATFAVVFCVTGMRECRHRTGKTKRRLRLGSLEQQKGVRRSRQGIGNSSTATARDISNLVRC